MDKKDRFSRAYSYLKDRGVVHTQKDVADKMGASAPNVSSALKGVESVLTDRFLTRFNEAFGRPFNDAWLLTGEGDMLCAHQQSGDITASNGSVYNNINGSVSTFYDRALDEIAEQRKLIAGTQEQLAKQLMESQQTINRLLDVIERMSQ